MAIHIFAMVCVAPAGEFLKHAPRSLASFSMYVDDIIMIFATEKCQRDAEGRACVVSEAVQGTETIVDLLQRKALLPIAKAKGKVLASAEEPGRQVARKLRNLGFRYQSGSQALGVDWGGGQAVKYKGCRERLRKASAKVKRLVVIRRGRGRTLMASRALAAGSARYGTKVVGLPDRLLAVTRTKVRTGTTTRAGGSSLTLDLHLQRGREVDPTYMANTEPIVQWAREVYGASKPRQERLADAWRASVGRVGLAQDPWKTITGPAGAVIATMDRVGWRLASWRHVHTSTGTSIDLQRTAPSEVKRRVIEATRQALLGQVNVPEDIGGELKSGIWLEPIRKVVLGKEAALGGCTRSVAVGGQWPQARLHAVGYSPIKLCQACGEG